MSKPWYETIIDVHLAVTDQVSHAEHMKSDRYFIWQEDGENVLLAGNFHAERAVTGSTDLYTKNEFDPWKEEFEAALDAAGLPWSYNSFQYEKDTGFYHHEWYWEVI
ncbi:MAG: hypothetical protein IIV02_06435 [Peptococcaceae bacterium]|nr:hypothetical protein [Peptococcaceae bacterium]